MSCAVIRNWSPLLRTEPSSTLATCSCRAISGISTPLPLNENDEVRAATLSCGIFESRFSNSSEMPSEQDPCSYFPPLHMSPMWPGRLESCRQVRSAELIGEKVGHG